MMDMLRSGSPQILLTSIASCTVNVARLRQVRTFLTPWTGSCFCSPVAPSTSRSRHSVVRSWRLVSAMLRRWQGG
jgi:hypothetical protein